MKNYKNLTPEERAKKTDMLLDTLQKGVIEYSNSENYKTLLSRLASFHQYSARNTILILSQCPNASCVASFKKWKDQFNRSVCRGEKAIKIFCPRFVKKGNTDNDSAEEEAEDETRFIGFSIGSVFDISQTQQIPGLEEIRLNVCERLTGGVDGYKQIIEAIKNITDANVVFDDLEGEACGCYYPLDNLIVVRSEMSEKQKVKTLLHEIAHAILHNLNESGRNLSRPDKELEAESTAFVVANYLGIDTSDYSFPYLVSWSSKENNLIDHLEYIKSASEKMINKLETVLA